MPYVAALYRYPLKGFTPEPRETLSILASGRVAGDRVLGLRFADTEEPDDAWSRKMGMLVLMNTPGLARLQVSFDHAALRLAVRLDGQVLVEASLDAEGRERVAQALERYALSLEISPLAGHRERLPLRLVGDGVTPRYHDSASGDVTLHGRESLRALAEALGDPQVSELRFRSNIAVEGLEAWEEHNWGEGTVRVGALEFRVARSKTRCMATQANPRTGQRDLPILTTLTHTFGQEQPTFAIAMTPLNAPGDIHVGDEVAIVG